MNKASLILLLLPFTISCFPRKCCPDQFKWSKGKSTQAEFQYNIALSEGNKIYSLGGTNRGAFESYDIRTKKWAPLPPIPIPVSFASGVLFNHSIYVMGGIDTMLNFSTAFQQFDLIQNRWTRLPALQTARSRATGVIFQDKIYLIGGMTGEDDRNAQNSPLVEVYNPVKGVWERKSIMPTARHGLAAVVEGNKILVAGGYTDEGETEIVEENDPVLDLWTRKADMPSPNGFFGLVAMENNIYALGGRFYKDHAPILKYDVNADQWTQVNTMPEAMNRFGITVIENRIYIIGGEENPHGVWIGKKI